MPVLFLTDVEGRWEKLVDFCQDNPWISLVGDRLELAAGATFVFGGDTIDRGPAGRRVLRALVELAERHPDRVVLLAGNRDINKLRLPRELGGHPRAGAPTGSTEEILRWTLARTMGAADAFVHRAAELGPGEEVVQSFLSDVAEDGLLFRYLRLARLGYRSGETLFVHGGVLEENLGVVPGEVPRTDVDEWLAALNRFYVDQLEAFAASPRGTGHDGLIAYQAPLAGTRANPTSVVYARPVDAMGNAILPSSELRKRLRDQGIRRVVVGHTPSGATPAIVRGGGFELIVADSSYARPERGSQVILDGETTDVRAWAQPEGGEVQRVVCHLSLDQVCEVGQRDSRTRKLVKGRLEDGRFLMFRFLPGFEPEETAVTSPTVVDAPENL